MPGVKTALNFPSGTVHPFLTKTLGAPLQTAAKGFTLRIVAASAFPPKPPGSLRSELRNCFRSNSTWTGACNCKLVLSTAEVASMPTQESFLHVLPSGLKLEVIVQRSAADKGTAGAGVPLVFVHGSYHAAWCWAEHWMPWFSARGHDCYAVSLLGQGGSDIPDAPVAGTLQSHAADVADLIRHLVGRPPVLLGHSFGGLIVQVYLAQLDSQAGNNSPATGGDVPPFPTLAGAALLCSVPPSGNKNMVMRFLRTRPILSIKMTLCLAARMFATSAGLCRDCFFSLDLPEPELLRYQMLMAGSSKLPLFDLRLLNASLPLPPPTTLPGPLLVLGAENDAVLDEAALQETGDYFSAPYTVVTNIAHDVMLDLRWESVAQTVADWMHSGSSNTG